MPDREVRTIRDLIYYQYAKIIAKSALGPDAKKSSYGFIKTTFRQLKSDEKRWSEILREDRQLVEAEKRCVYCGTTEDLSWEHIVRDCIISTVRCIPTQRYRTSSLLFWKRSTSRPSTAATSATEPWTVTWEGH